jgi:predicted enzyme related to lactoylglutathione lyase
MPDIGPVAGVLIWTSEERFPAMRDFYRDTLGLTARSVKPRFVNFEWAGFRLSVSVHDDVSGANHDPLRSMLNLAVEDIEAVHARLSAAGVEFSRPPEAEPWGGVVATFQDPDGNTLQLMQLPAEPEGR